MIDDPSVRKEQGLYRTSVWVIKVPVQLMTGNNHSSRQHIKAASGPLLCYNYCNHPPRWIKRKELFLLDGFFCLHFVCLSEKQPEDE